MLEDRPGQPSGRLGFIDFGIVGRMSPGTWMAVEALLMSTATRDFDTMARALVTIGATSSDVDIQVPLNMAFLVGEHSGIFNILCSSCHSGVFCGAFNGFEE